MDTYTGPERRAKIDWMGLLRTYGRVVLIVAVAVAVIVAVVGGAYIRWGQATQTVASLEFRPTFTGLSELEYPNGLPFSPNDVIADSIIDRVYDTNNVEPVCEREVFRAGIYVEQRSDQSVFLDLEYQSRLTEPRITPVERKLLQEEHAAKRNALPLQYRLVFVAPPTCSGLTQTVISKILVDTLATWASESESKRGVLKVQVEVLTPASLDLKVGEPGGQLLRADLLRNALTRIAENIETVAELPGAELVRLEPGKLSFAELQVKIGDLIGSRLDPLVMTSGRRMVLESSRWVEETVAAAKRRQAGALEKIQNYQTALQAYSGSPEPVTSTRTGIAPRAPASGASGQQAPLTSIDESFIDRIVELSDANVRYRQKLTDALVEAQLSAVAEGLRASYYKRLLQSARGQGGDPEGTDLSVSLDEIVRDGKAITKQFNDLYDEYCRLSLRSAAAMYEARKPVTIETSQRYARSTLLNLVLIAFAGTAVLTFGFFAARSRLQAARS